MIRSPSSPPSVHGELRSGFTLIELLVVVAIIALLISILLPSLSQAREQARTVQCSSIQKQIGFANEMYADANDQYYVSLYDNSPETTSQFPSGAMGMWALRPGFRTMIGIEPLFLNVPQQENWWPIALSCPKMPDEFHTEPFYNYGFNHDPTLYFSPTQPFPAKYPHRPSIQQASSTYQLTDSSDIRVWIAGWDYEAKWDQYGNAPGIQTGGGSYAIATYRHNEGAPILHYDGHVEYFSKEQAYDVDNLADHNRRRTIYKD